MSAAKGLDEVVMTIIPRNCHTGQLAGATVRHTCLENSPVHELVNRPLPRPLPSFSPLKDLRNMANRGYDVVVDVDTEVSPAASILPPVSGSETDAG